MPKTEGDEAQPKIMPTKIGPKKPKKIFKYRFLTETNLHNVQRAQIYFYIVSLHKKIKTLLNKCKRYREKIRKLVSMTTSHKYIYFESILINALLFFDKLFCSNQKQASRKCSITPEKESTHAEVKDTPANNSEGATNTFIADIKNAAQQAQNDTGFIYEPTSGLYYDQRTGYYYNAVRITSNSNANCHNNVDCIRV